MKDYVDAASSGSSDALATEITNRANADDSIKANLATEITNRKDADSTLTANLGTEITNRTDSEETIKADLALKLKEQQIRIMIYQLTKRT